MGKQDKQEKTNVMRLLDQANVEYRHYQVEATGQNTGVEMAQMLGEDPDRVFKTLVTFCDKTKENYVFVIPVNLELNLKKAAQAVGAKSIQMHKSRDLLPLTGYIHGGCSPIGMKKFFRTTIHETAMLYDTIFFSGGKIGFQVEVNPEDLAKVIPFEYADLCD